MISNLQRRLEDLQQKVLIEEGSLRSKELALQQLVALLNTLETEIGVLGQVDAALNELSSRVMGQSTKFIDNLVTTGLRYVFDDLKLDFKTEVDKYRGKTSVRFVLTQDGQEAPIMDSYGGGVVVVAGVLLRIVTVISLKGRRFLLLDETLAHLSKQYIPNMSRLLSKLCESLSFDILMITHTEDFAEYATSHFKATSVNGGTVFNKVTLKGASS